MFVIPQRGQLEMSSIGLYGILANVRDVSYPTNRSHNSLQKKSS